ncbi:MAG: ligase-associated DNA damage response endonuclease PdeM [Aestuariivirgaceae bacterium]
MMHFSKRPHELSSTRPAGPGNGQCASLALGGLELRPDLSGALYVPDYRTLLVADLHFEKGSSFLRRGLHIPPFDTRSTLAVLESAITRLRPERLIALGDSFHDGSAGDRIDAGDLQRIRRLSDDLDVIWIIGNHDPRLPDGLSGTTALEVSLGTLTLRHLPQPVLAGALEIAGHFHPVASVVRRGRRLTSRSFVADHARLIMPAFGAYTGGLDVRAPEISSLFSRQGFTVWMIGRSAIYSFSSSALR